MPLAGAGRSPQIFAVRHRAKAAPPPESKPWVCALLPTGTPCRKAKPLPTKQVARLALYRRQVVTRRQANLNPKANQRFAQSRVKGRCPLRVQGGARELLPTGNFGESRFRTLISKPNGLRHTAGGRSHAEGEPEPTGKTIIPRCLTATGNYLYDKGENDEQFQRSFRIGIPFLQLTGTFYYTSTKK